jgi:hypothetical protein
MLLVALIKGIQLPRGWILLGLALMGGIGYTNVYPIERGLRDARLSIIWTGTSEIMNLIIQHEYYKEVLAGIAKPGTAKPTLPNPNSRRKRYMSDRLRGKYCIAGIGESELGKLENNTTIGLSLIASKKALDDAGTSAKEVDGVIAMTASGGGFSRLSLRLGELLGMMPLGFILDLDLEGATAAAMVQHAIMAMESGACRAVLCVIGGMGEIGEASFDPINQEMYIAGCSTECSTEVTTFDSDDRPEESVERSDMFLPFR